MRHPQSHTKILLSLFMRNAHIITDLGFGDSGKGAIADRIAAEAIDKPGVVVIRSAGGSQAGHTVDLNIEDGRSDPQRRHIHSSFAAGTLGNFRGHMSHYCPIYPQNLVREGEQLEVKCDSPLTASSSVDPLAPWITVYDVAWNRINHRGNATVGVGIGATMERMLTSEYKTFMGDLLHTRVYSHKLRGVHSYYMQKLKATFLDPNDYKLKEELFLENVARESLLATDALDFVRLIPTYSVIKAYNTVIFEGAQGVMLDQDHGFMPYVTWGHTTSRNAVEMINAVGAAHTTVHHLTRAYQTRHGDGPTTFEEELRVPVDQTNVWNHFQGKMRTGTLDPKLIAYAQAIDMSYVAKLAGRYDVRLHMTCCDHLEPQDLAGVVKAVLRQLDHQNSIECWYGGKRDAKVTNM